MTFINSLILCLLIAFSYTIATRNVKNEPIVNTRTGHIRGLVQESITGDKYLAFKGIPYAKPPVGQLRFEVSIRCEK